MERFKKNLTSTVLGFNHVLARMFPQQNAGTLLTEPVSPMDARKERYVFLFNHSFSDQRILIRMYTLLTFEAFY